MGNSKSGQLSPKAYIKTKARNLPIYECLTTEGWKNSFLTQAVVARQHKNGNLTVGIYLIDLSLLGIKDSFFLFNIPDYEYEEMKEKFFGELDYEIVDYTVVHNLVYAGLEFAESIELKPHRDFTEITRYILEEDNDDIELMDIPVGENGVPHYIEGPNDTPATRMKILNHLDRVLGKDQYYHTRYLGFNEEFDNEFDDEFDDDYDDEIDDDYDEDLEEFEEFISKQTISWSRLKEFYDEFMNYEFEEDRNYDKWEIVLERFLELKIQDKFENNGFHLELPDDLNILYSENEFAYDINYPVDESIDKELNELIKNSPPSIIDIFEIMKEFSEKNKHIPYFELILINLDDSISSQEKNKLYLEFCNKHPKYVNAITSLFDSYVDIKEYEKALDVFHHQVEISKVYQFRTSFTLYEVTNFHDRLLNYYVDTGKLEKAIYHFYFIKKVKNLDGYIISLHYDNFLDLFSDKIIEAINKFEQLSFDELLGSKKSNLSIVK
jgi:hypothetical protein